MIANGEYFEDFQRKYIGRLKYTTHFIDFGSCISHSTDDNLSNFVVALD